MSCQSSRLVKKSLNTMGFAQPFPATNETIHWNHTIRSYGNNFGDFLIPHQDLSQADRLLNSFGAMMPYFRSPRSLCSQSSAFCTSSQFSPSSILEPLPQIPGTWSPEYAVTQTQALPPVPQLQSEELAYEQYEDEMNGVNGHSELFGEIVAGNFDWTAGVNPDLPASSTEEQLDWQVEADQFDLLLNNDQNPVVTESYIPALQVQALDTMSMERHQIPAGQPLDAMSMERQSIPAGQALDAMNMERQLIPAEQAFEGTSMERERKKCIMSSLDEETNSGSSDALNNKARIRWTGELHACFVEAVNELGGADKATPKSIKTKMGIEWITLYHVKSHLQKYRLIKQQQAEEGNRPSTSGVKKKTAIANESSEITENELEKQKLHTQLKLQKILHDQIESTRQLQMRAEENARMLEKLLEDQRRVREAFIVTSQSARHNPPDLTDRTNESQSSNTDGTVDENNNENLDHVVSQPSSKKTKLDT